MSKTNPHPAPLNDDTWRDRASYLYAAISDSQETLRAVDAKINILMAMQLAVLPLMLGTFKFSTELAHHFGKGCFLMFLVLFAVIWLVAIALCVAGVHARHGNKVTAGPRDGADATFFPTEAYYQPGSRGAASLKVKQFILDLPATPEACVEELAREHLRIGWIRTRKMVFQRWAAWLSLSWISLAAIAVMVYAWIVVTG